MPNYILSRTSPPAHIYERKINLGYGIKVDTSDAPTPEPNKGKKMNDVKTTLGVADQPVIERANEHGVTFADGTVFVQSDEDYPNPDAALGPKATEEAKEVTVN